VRPTDAQLVVARQTVQVLSTKQQTQRPKRTAGKR